MGERIERRVIKSEKGEQQIATNLPYGIKTTYYPVEQYFEIWKKNNDMISMPAKSLEECEYYLHWFIDAIKYIHEFI